jgi:hypothetical protein
MGKKELSDKSNQTKSNPLRRIAHYSPYAGGMSCPQESPVAGDVNILKKTCGLYIACG